MQRKYIILALVILLIGGGAIAAYFIAFSKSDVSVGSKKADFEIDAFMLLGSFENDELSANEKYLGKILIVSGEIHNISHDSISTSLYIKDRDSRAGVICRFDHTVLNPGHISEGEQISVKGICTGYLLDVIMNKCVPVKH